MENKETHKRSIAKAATYRVYQSLIITPTVVYILTGDINLVATIGLIDLLIKTPSYFLFERTWGYIKKGYN